ncbi:TMAO reductase system periplasmic protein TorT [Pragia fontium]|uniref:TMAO reductase system periplasmic protein TorT n=1 Tax=Pragia fontium TaxID=82985 RepID=UPI000E0065A5|nr:TMAO reductase system periplasmic protein TorT [Pragia fontium]SUB83584.1 Periplasmic protein torT precursor [Pragia fontium]VEJ56489.1 Periplasmic protein torT precursor [Pragia fontium]
MMRNLIRLLGITLLFTVCYANSFSNRINVWSPPFSYSTPPEEQSYRSVTAKQAWRLCALYPHLKDSYWLSVNYGMVEQARLSNIELQVFDAGGYYSLATQLEQIQQCRSWGADAILLGAISFDRINPQLTELAGNIPVLGLINETIPQGISARVGVPWREMGINVGQFLAQRSQHHPLKVLLLPGPQNRGGTDLVEQGFYKEIAGHPIEVVDIAWGDNDHEAQRNLLQQMLEQHPDINLIAGSAVAIEAAIPELQLHKLADNVDLVSFYLSHEVYRGLKRHRVLMANSDQMVLQGRLSVDQAIRLLQKEPLLQDIGPKILTLTPENLADFDIHSSLSPGEFRPEYEVHSTSATNK